MPLRAGTPSPAPLASRPLRLRLAAAVLAMLTACGGCFKSDAERAAEERAKIEERIRDSYALVPYRAMKLTLRAKGDPSAPPEVDQLWQRLAETQQLPHKAQNEEEARRVAEAYLKLAVAFYKAKKTLEVRDEDEFPLLSTLFVGDKLAGLPGYDAGQEHLFFSAVWLILDTADRGNRLPVSELVFYELARATPGKDWLPITRLVARLARGYSFCDAGYHYAAEEELTGYLTELRELPPESFSLESRPLDSKPEQVRETMLATGHFLRAWNRMALKRERPAEDDIEQGLRSLEKLGIENELTWWGWAFIHFRRERYEESATYLDKLAASPYLDEKARAEVHASAEEMRRHGDTLPVFLQARAAVILAQALVARAGGMETILVTVLGEEQGRKMYAPVAWMDRARTGMSQLNAELVVREAGGTLDKAREAGGKGLEDLKAKLRLGKDAGKDTSAGASPP